MMKRFIQLILLLFISSGICFAQQSRQTGTGNPVIAVNKTSVYAAPGVVNVTNYAAPFSETGNVPPNYPGYHTVNVQTQISDRAQNQKQVIEISNQAVSEFPLNQTVKRVHVAINENENAELKSGQKKVEITQAAVKVE